MKLNRILVPIDYSFHSKVANYYASLFAGECGAHIVYLNVNWPSTNEGSLEERLDGLYEHLSRNIRPLAYEVEHSFEVRDGEPAKQILKVAQEHNVDLIVMGTQGRTGASRILHGSVCEKVLRKSSCPVMAVKSAINMNWLLDENDENPGSTDPAVPANSE